MLAALAVAARAVPSKSPKPILFNVLLIAERGSLVVAATDCEVGVRHAVADALVTEPGEVCLHAERLHAALREMRGESVEIETTGTNAVVKGESAKFVLPTMPAVEFPVVRRMTEESFFTVPGEALLRGLRYVSFCVGESAQYVLGGVRIELGSPIHLAATDSNRLSVFAISAETDGTPEEAKVSVPMKAVKLLESVVTSDAVVHLAVTDGVLYAQSEAATVTTRLIDGSFPRWRNIIPADSSFRSTVSVHPGELGSALRQVAICTSEESKAVEFAFAAPKLLLSGEAAAVGASEVSTTVEYAGEPVTLWLNPSMLGDALKQLDPDDKATLHLIDGDSAVLLRSESGMTFIQMPIVKE